MTDSVQAGAAKPEARMHSHAHVGPRRPCPEHGPPEPRLINGNVRVFHSLPRAPRPLVKTVKQEAGHFVHERLRPTSLAARATASGPAF
jgi:hypothetical protein